MELFEVGLDTSICFLITTNFEGAGITHTKKKIEGAEMTTQLKSRANNRFIRSGIFFGTTHLAVHNVLGNKPAHSGIHGR